MVYRSSLHVLQANFGAMDHALAAIADMTPQGAAVLDLHAGGAC